MWGVEGGDAQRPRRRPWVEEERTTERLHDGEMPRQRGTRAPRCPYVKWIKKRGRRDPPDSSPEPGPFLHPFSLQSKRKLSVAAWLTSVAAFSSRSRFLSAQRDIRRGWRVSAPLPDLRHPPLGVGRRRGTLLVDGTAVPKSAAQTIASLEGAYGG